MKKNLLLCLIILIIIRNIMTREEFKAEMAEKKERAEARINSALQMFADMIIDRMEVIEASNWKQGWTDGEAMIGLPQNVTGRVYTGSNAFLCQLHSMKNNYKVPVYLTFPQLKDLGAFPKKGEKSIPIFKWGFSIHNRETGEKATLEEYDSIPKEERDKKYKVIPYLKIFNEWNIDQTNLEEVNKEKYDALLSKFEAKEIKDDNGMYSNAAIDQMLASQSWVCPIEYTQQNPSALYNKSKDVIIVPRKDQFNISDTPEEIYKDGEEYYSSLIHEMAHSTGHESRLNRLSPDGKFGGEEYAKEELVAELTAAMVGSALGFDSRIRDNNTAYLKSWMSALKKEPKFLLSVMSDVNKASAMVIEHIDEERVKLGEKALLDGNLDGEEEREKNEKEMQKIVNDATQEKESFSAFRESRTFQVLKGIIISAEWNTGNPLHNVSNFQDFKKAFASVTDIDKFEPSYPKADEKDLTLLKTQVAAMSQKELLEAGAYMLPYYHYPHKEGRTLEDIRQSFRRIEKIGKANPGNEQIQKRVEQARSIYNRYEQNVMDQYKSYEISEDEMKIPSIPMPRYTYIEGLPQLEARQQIQKEFNSLESYMKAISLKSGEVSVRYNIDNNMLEAWREVDGNSELFTSRKYDRRMDGISNMDDFVFHLANEDAKAANMPLYSENKENKMMLEYIEKRAFVWSRLNNQLKHPSGEILIFDYVKEKDAIDAFVMSGEGKRKVYSMHFGEGGETILQNYNFVKKELLSMKQFQKKEDPREAVAKEWDSLAEKPTVKMESGDVLPVEYNKEKDTLDVLITNGAGKQEVYSTNYDHDRSIKGNLGYVWEELSNMKQYQSTKEASPEKENKEKASATQEKKGEVYYYSYAYLQSTDDTQEFDDLQKKGDYKQILQQAQMYDQGDALEQSKTFKNAKKYGNDDILDEDDHYAVVYNNGNGGTYELMRKVTKEEILDDIDRYGLEQDASEDVKKVAYESVAKQFSEIKAQIPAFTMPNNDVLYVQYNQEKNQVEVGHVTNIGLMKEHTFDYDVNQTLDANLEAINESLQENEEYQAIEEDEEEAESLDEDNQVKVPREDSNIETDVAGMAKQFAAEGMSMEEAEQKAKSIVEEQQHQEHYDEEKQKDAEQKQQQKKQEEQAKKEEEKKTVNHAALLFAALGLASEKNGVWMNRAQRQPAEFIHSHTPVTAYNSIMMTLNTDANKYKTNVYTFYKSAAENNLPVKRNEESLKFNWVNWNYQNMMNHDDIITQKKYDTLSDEEKSFYAKHASRVEQHIYNVDQTIMNAKDHEAYGNLVKTKGAPFVKAEERTISVLQQYNDYQKKHPDVVVLKKTGDSYEIYGEKASDVAKILNLEIEKKKMDGKKVDLVSFPSQHLDTYLPKIIRAGNRVSINDNLKEKKVSIPVQDNTAILNKAYSTAKAVADQSGMKYERIMVVQDTKYDKVDDKIVVSGMSEKTADENHATLYKANDIYRAVVAAVGSEERLDRSGRNSFLPEDDAKHEKLVQELAAGVLMTRQGLPAILSKESEKLVPYWQRELTENPKMLGVLERDVNNAVETIDSILAKREVDYKAIRGQMPGKILTENPERFSISSSLAKLPSMETKEMVVVLDKKHKTADVILPAGASLQVNNEVPGMNKKRILTALGKMGVKEVSFYNAGGGLSLHESNDYYKGKEVTVSKLKQYELLTQQTVDLKDKFAPKKEVKITTFEALPDDMGRYAFFIKAENEPSFAVYPNKEHVNQFYSSLKSENRAVVHNALAKKYYELGTKHPDARVDVITPRKVNIGDAKIDRICITAKRNDPKQHIIFATVNGERMHAPVSKAQWNKMWLSEDMSDYKQRLAAVIFEPFIKKEVKNDVNQQASEKKDETVKPDSPAPEKEQEEQVEQTSRKGRGIH